MSRRAAFGCARLAGRAILAAMTPRERVAAAMDYRAPDRIPLQIHPSPAGLYEHGPKLLDLLRSCGHDFGDADLARMPEAPGPEDFDPDGRYHAVRTDAWGTTWEYRIFGVWGHPLARPLDDLAALDTWRPPYPPPLTGPEFLAARAAADTHRTRWHLIGDGGALFETLRWVRRFEDVLVDIEEDTPAINRIADLIHAHNTGLVAHALALGCDSIGFGDDLGTRSALMISPAAFRRFFKPRYRELFAPVLDAGRRVLFHSCGQIGEALEDLRDVGVTALWPQLPLYDPADLARRCRELGIAVQLHPDRGELMQRGTPDAIRTYALRLVDLFQAAGGGSWLYIEIDPGFPWRNVEALLAVAREVCGR
jgi:uroporphyrinogen decarboxylase